MDIFYNPEDVFSFLNAEKAREYIGKRGFFAHSLTELNNITQDGGIPLLDTDTLKEIRDFRTAETQSPESVFLPDVPNAQWHRFFIPADKVRQPEPKIPMRRIKDFEDLARLPVPLRVGDTVELRCEKPEDLRLRGYMRHVLVLLGVRSKAIDECTIKAYANTPGAIEEDYKRVFLIFGPGEYYTAKDLMDEGVEYRVRVYPETVDLDPDKEPEPDEWSEWAKFEIPENDDEEEP